jgi:Tfp pilus assembly protein PilN
MEKDIDSKQTSSENSMQQEQPKQNAEKHANLRFACMLIISLAVIVYLVHSLKVIQGRYDSLARNLQSGLEQVTNENRDIQGKYDSLAKLVNERLEQVVGENKNIQDKYDSLAKLVNEGLEQAAKENKDCIARALQAEYEIKSNSSYAGEALKLAENALAGNDIELAKIYLLNAINHMPYEIKYIEAYFQLLEKLNPALEDLKRFSDILDMSVFQIAPGDIQRIVAMKNTIMQKMEAMNIAEQEKSAKAYQEALAQKVASLVDGRLSMEKIIKRNGSVNLDLLSTRIETIRSLLDEDILDENEAGKWRAELSKANVVFQLAATLVNVDNATSKAAEATAQGAPSKMDLITAQNQLQTANALLAQIWTMDCSPAPELLERAKAYQTKITEIDTKIKELGSRPAFEEIKKLVENIRYDYYQSQDKYTARIKRITSNVEKIKEKLAEISDDKMQMEVLADLKKAGEFLQDLAKIRYNKYQKWALELLQECHKKYKSYNVVTDARGNALFNSYLLDINPALLSYDMQSLYNSIYQKVYEEVEDKAASQITKGSHTCRSLEDF